MGCAELVNQDGKVVGYICRAGELEELKGRVRKWCFKCRKRRLYKRFMLVAEWYDPELVLKCPKCGGDYSRFPGW